VDFVSWGQSTSFAPRVFGFFLVFFPLARRRFSHRKVYCFTCVMAAEINSKYKKFRGSALLATVRARTFVCLVFTDFWSLSVILTCIDVFCKQSLCFCERVCDAPLFLGAFWDLNYTSCVSVVAILCYWRSFLKALYEHGSLFIVLLLRMSVSLPQIGALHYLCFSLENRATNCSVFVPHLRRVPSPELKCVPPRDSLALFALIAFKRWCVLEQIVCRLYDLPCFDRVWFLETLICISCNTVCLLATFSSRKVGAKYEWFV
jgi:hypothetical protein